MIRSYPELKNEVARLAAKDERVQRFELPSLIAEINMLVERYQLTEAMIFGKPRNASPVKSKTVMVPKYVN